ncbi:MAG TPA: bifunctional DNA-formamidopyrimidine glycosylase/DNA-(apurinic or apyrimidinic site) lyase [Bryobacteraceae bacterium]|nr:bifunctional DNA-formamidopyrimidine glycosylase/DNA-(apurinic or apyrimidinic site) lyase [Bryobacteraceae bacterium]
MPELPEVETVVRSLAPRLTGRRILHARFSSRHVVRDNFKRLAAKLAGQTVRGVTRHGKFIVAQLDKGNLIVHLGMTGALLFDAPAGPHTRAVFDLDNGVLLYDDPRQFGRIEWAPELPARVARLGPDALHISEADFLTLLRRRHARIKPLLLNQSFLRGMGNIYSDEALFQAGVHPRAMASRLSKQRAARLHRAMIDILGAAIANKGSSISDYVDAEGRRGTFQHMHQVYGREGQPCTRCGAPIRRVVLGGRGTHYCPKCQRL